MRFRFLNFQPFFFRLQTVSASCLVGLLRVLPLIVCFRLGQLLGLLAYVVLPTYRKLSRKNLLIALGETFSSSEINSLVRKNFMTLGANLLSSLKIPALSKEQLSKVMIIEDTEAWNKAITRINRQGTVAALSHFGNWELNAQISTFVESRATGAIYQPLRNKALDDLVNSDRRSRGVKTFDRKRDLSAATTLLREGGVLGVLIDQHAGDAGMWIPFFNKLASTSPLAATLAQRTGAMLVQVTIPTIAPARWAVRITEPIATEGRSIGEITYDLGCQLAKEIQRSPADWFWVHNRWKLPNPMFLLSRVKRGLYVPEKSSLQSFNLLVRSPNWLGDACMAAPAIQAIKKGRPDLHLTILTPQKLTGLWEALPEIDEVISIPPKATPWKVAKMLRERTEKRGLPGFEAALLIPNSVRSALEAWLSGIPRRIGRVGKKGKWRALLINQPFPKNLKTSSLHQADEYLAVAHWLGAPIDKIEKTHEVIHPIGASVEFPNSQQLLSKFAEGNEEQGSDSAQKLSVHHALDVSSTDATQLFGASVEFPNSQQLLSKFAEGNEEQGSDSAQKLSVHHVLDVSSTDATQLFGASVEFRKKFRVGVCPGAEYGPAKRWPIERFRSVMDRLATFPITWVLLGTRAEAPLGKILTDKFHGTVENFMGETSLSELIKLIQELDVVLTNDTGTMHLAALFKIPTISIFGSTDPNLTGPRGVQHHVLHHAVSCSPCFLRTCPIDFRCMTTINPEEVIAVIKKQLKIKSQ